MGGQQDAALTYLKLASLCDRRGHSASRDRLLICAAEAALNAGWPEVAEGCRDVVLRGNRHHMLRRWPTFREAVRDIEFGPLLRRCRRFCSLERAESLLEVHQAEVAAVLRASGAASDATASTPPDPSAVARALLEGFS